MKICYIKCLEKSLDIVHFFEYTIEAIYKIFIDV